MAAKGDRSDSDAVGKALRLLCLLGEHPEGVGVSRLARDAGYPVSTTHRLLGSLQRDGFVRSDGESRRYSLGLRMFELGQRVSQARGFTGVALPVMRRVTELTGEPTLMSVLDGRHQLYVHHVQGPRRIRVIGEPAKHGPLHCTSMGKCLIAFAPDEVRAELVEELELTPLGPATITDRARFREEIDRVREQGYAVSDEEHEAGIRAVGVPIVGPGGTALAALSTPAPAYRVTMRELTGSLPFLLEAAAELAVLLPTV
ncbi:IclR family transcriptional regulator [Actinoallomurus oryzae]|jgi:DNA-binding IclR family transcriptional regulator|uniref:IclR family transcriptional regulator n=1 Tax=Actinoallomurus oryzae TaxID=502180 RepID=A0ABP8QUT2_9ACTN